jgi:hypothetical protein
MFDFITQRIRETGQTLGQVYRNNAMKNIKTLFMIYEPFIFISTVGLLVLRPLLAYCTSPG